MFRFLLALAVLSTTGLLNCAGNTAGHQLLQTRAISGKIVTGFTIQSAEETSIASTLEDDSDKNGYDGDTKDDRDDGDEEEEDSAGSGQDLFDEHEDDKGADKEKGKN